MEIGLSEAPIPVPPEADSAMIGAPIVPVLCVMLPEPIASILSGKEAAKLMPRLKEALFVSARTGPPPRFKVVGLMPEDRNDRLWPDVGMILIAPPEVESVAEEPLGEVIVRELPA